MTSETAGLDLTRRRLRLVGLVNLLILIVLGTPSSLAAEPPDDSRFLAVPYFWVANVDAKLGLGQLSLPISLDTGDLFSYIDYGAMGYLQWNFNNSFMFADGTVAGTDTKQFEPFFNAPLQADFRAVEAGYGRHFVLKPDSGPFRELLVSPHIGMLHANLDGRLSGMFNMDIEHSWTGMAVGVTVSAPINRRFTLTMRSVHSGFHGELKDFVNALAAVRFRMNDRVALAIGYRVANARYVGDDAFVDVDLKGALLGLELSW